MVLLQTSPCDQYECQNGAQCIVVQQEPTCRCPPGFAGPRCEKLITVNFVGKDSYVELASAKVRPQANISLQVSPALWPWKDPSSACWRAAPSPVASSRMTLSFRASGRALSRSPRQLLTHSRGEGSLHFRLVREPSPAEGPQTGFPGQQLWSQCSSAWASHGNQQGMPHVVFACTPPRDAWVIGLG